MAPTLPPTLEVCTRIRDGYPCLGRIHRSGVPEISTCGACGSREAGVVYTLQPARAARIVAAAGEISSETWQQLARWLRTRCAPWDPTDPPALVTMADDIERLAHALSAGPADNQVMDERSV